MRKAIIDGDPRISGLTDIDWDNDQKNPHVTANGLSHRTVPCTGADKRVPCAEYAKEAMPTCTITIYMKNGVKLDNTDQTRTGRSVLNHEIAHVAYVKWYAQKVTDAWESVGNLCIPTVCQEKRREYLNALENAYRAQRGSWNADFHIKEYEEKDEAYWTRRRDSKLKDSLEDRKMAVELRKELVNCMKANDPGKLLPTKWPLEQWKD